MFSTRHSLCLLCARACVHVQIWDTAGQERFQSLGVAFYRYLLNTSMHSRSQTHGCTRTRTDRQQDRESGETRKHNISLFVVCMCMCCLCWYVQRSWCVRVSVWCKRRTNVSECKHVEGGVSIEGLCWYVCLHYSEQGGREIGEEREETEGRRKEWEVIEDAVRELFPLWCFFVCNSWPKQLPVCFVGEQGWCGKQARGTNPIPFTLVQ